MRKKTGINPKHRKSVIVELTKEYGYRCWYCGIKFNNDSEIDIDHIIPYSMSKDNNINNLALACQFCNIHKLNYSVETFLKYLARIRTGQFECLIIKDRVFDLDENIKDILNKSFY